MFLQKLTGSFFEFPGFLILTLILFLIFARKTISRPVRIFLIILVVFLFVFSTGFIARFFLLPLEGMKVETVITQEPDPGSYIVVLSGDVNNEIPPIAGLRDNFEIGKESLVRTNAAYDLYKKIDSPIVVTGGNLDSLKGKPAADLMAMTLLNWNVPSHKIIIENQARTTRENAFYVLKLLPGEIQRLYVVTSAMHLSRSVFAFETLARKMRVNIKITGIPCGYSSVYDGSIYSFIPGKSVFFACMNALHEYIGFLYYGLTM